VILLWGQAETSDIEYILWDSDY